MFWCFFFPWKNKQQATEKTLWRTTRSNERRKNKNTQLPQEVKVNEQIKKTHSSMRLPAWVFILEGHLSKQKHYCWIMHLGPYQIRYPYTYSQVDPRYLRIPRYLRMLFGTSLVSDLKYCGFQKYHWGMSIEVICILHNILKYNIIHA